MLIRPYNFRLRPCAALCALIVFGSAALTARAANPANDPPDLESVPQDLSTSVDPNIVVTFDDSGSMAWTHMGDNRPFDDGTWNGPWRCANVIDPRVLSRLNPKSRSMNGVYYNPTINYVPALDEKGNSFDTVGVKGKTDATLNAVWEDGIAVNRPVGTVTPAAVAFNNNPDGNASTNSNNRVTNIMGTKVGATDNRWQCGGNSSSFVATNPFDGTVADPDTGAKPNGGPYYYRLKSSVTIIPVTDIDSSGNFTAAGKTKLYTAANWEAVSVPGSQYQNFANWYGYYRFRNVMARTSMSRVFGALGDNIRVTWQNLNNATYQLPASTIITNLNNSATDPTTGNPYRKAFFNWIYQVPAQNSTPSRSAAIRAGNFFKRGNTANLQDPYWQPASGSQPAQELACRQNFHLLMTDGLYNQPAVSVSGNGSTTASGQNLPGPPVELATDPATYSVGSGTSPTTLFKGFATDSDTGSTYSDISFYYWANNLRPDLVGTYPNDRVAPNFPDFTVGVTGPAAAVIDPLDPGATPEVFWNPANDPATWPHVVQFAVTLGAFGVLNYSNDIDCDLNDGFGVGNDDLCKLRKGVANSSGAIGWSRPNGAGGGIPANIDDLWHAALNSRGAFFVATNPDMLVRHLTDILTNIQHRSGQSTSVAVSTSIQTQGSAGYAGGYDSSKWLGYLYKDTLDATTANPTAAVWDAGCLLTGGTFTPVPPVGPPVNTPPRGNCKVTAASSPPARVIFTSDGTANSGKPFEWGNLNGAEQAALNIDPTTATVNLTTGVVTGTADGNGQYRAQYLHGDRTYESAPTPTSSPIQFRKRAVLLGAIVNSQAVYEGAPSGGFQDIYPFGSPEQVAATLPICDSSPSSSSCHSYENFVSLNKKRRPLVYVGANDGMLHAFDAVNGSEAWAYVPNMLYANNQLDQLTDSSKSNLINAVDNTPTIQDVFMNGAWHTILVGSMRLGARGVYALDVTDAGDPAGEGAAANKFLWEFSSKDDPDLGYTYALANVARLRCNTSPCAGLGTTNTGTPGGTWVVLVSSGYFPACLGVPMGSIVGATGSCPTGTDGLAAAATNRTHLWILNATDGSVIKKLDTPSAIVSYGLSTPGVVDFSLDQLDDVAVAGDLAGNLWRFDLSDPDPSNWAVDQMFKTYTSAANTGYEPISVMPVAFPTTSSVVYVFGSGEYLGNFDKTGANVATPQHFFGVIDAGKGSASYPILESQLATQTLTQSANGVRSITNNPPTGSGWMIPLNISGIAGERDVTTAAPLFSIGTAVVVSLIPGANTDLCSPGRLGAIMAICAATGGPICGNATVGSTVIGELVSDPPIVGGPQLISELGGGAVKPPGLPPTCPPGSANCTPPPPLTVPTPIWRQTSWRELLDQM